MLTGTSASAVCVGSCGTAGANGDITASPLGGTYDYVTTAGGVSGAGSLGVDTETNGSINTTGSFAADAGSVLSFYFNYVTSDGSGFADYGWSQLQTVSGNAVATLFTARTTPSGDTVPGFGLPGLLATLTPGSTPIQIGTGGGGGPVWSGLGGDSGRCFDTGCGYTGWIRADYTIAAAGNYRLAFGVTNWSDTQFASGLAYDGVIVDGNPVPGVPEPGTWAMLIAGFGLVGAAARRRRTAIA
ncbi:PEPxxWA-CTERM sorting domain-containing protein [Polymorphobacter fuscus]|uniref:PEPxxWA-CTERM sorting domain-containing protein n=2 Tax=Sandarakinorhabdus fusca TaxID=1439888 RepID=A0A7C9GNU7_9SPHN|nr:PEP-CTERM sorting domain-containing protein [Polymorphobacter fuscus]MQT17032.1 PEPxxWA-CTERM sorting domain-containing protein [Polymorphobacter fuscus]